ncbi:MAG: hypothetical protein LBV79_12255 [Candidatus Adiutrix sp.]|nr:hypothetical protein [Candidatus Adiutrix sp.]
MSDEIRDKDKNKFEFPMMPIYGVDLGRELGDLAAGQRQLNARMDKLEDKIDAVEARLTAKIDAVDARLTDKIEAVDSRVDKCLVAINRLDERTQSQGRALWGFGIAIFAAVIAGIILQYFDK